jgi:tetratricopeptide (TPR) repeat protein
LKIIKQLSFVVLVFIVLFNQAMAESASDIYQRELSDKGTGVYEQGGWVFFVVKQQCLRNKKYAGTEESKVAERNFYSLLAKEVVNRSISFSSDIKDIGQPLRDDIKQDISKSFSAESALKHKLLFDRNTKSDSCVQEYVVVLDSNQFKPNGVTIPRTQVERSATKLLLASLERQDYPLTQQYLESLDQKQLADIYRLIGGDHVISVNLSMNDSTKACYANDCSLAEKPFSPHDINKVVATAIARNGMVKIQNMNPSEALANMLYQKAKTNFTQGTNANAIIQDLTMAVNLAPQHSAYWKMLADIARALGKKQLTQAASMQYILHTPDSAEAWVYLYLAMNEESPVVAHNLKRWLKNINQNNSFSSWAEQQISGE